MNGDKQTMEMMTDRLYQLLSVTEQLLNLQIELRERIGALEARLPPTPEQDWEPLVRASRSDEIDPVQNPSG